MGRNFEEAKKMADEQIKTIEQLFGVEIKY